jgi:two-component system NtrC family sensor kinase
VLNVYNISFYAVNEKYKQQRDGYEPTITVSTKKIGDKVEIRVKDNGNGIPQKFWTKFFNLFPLPNLPE